MMTLLDKPVASLGLSVKTRNHFSRQSIETLGDILNRESLGKLMREDNFGPESLREVKLAIMKALDIEMVVK